MKATGVDSTRMVRNELLSAPLLNILFCCSFFSEQRESKTRSVLMQSVYFKGHKSYYYSRK